MYFTAPSLLEDSESEGEEEGVEENQPDSDIFSPADPTREDDFVLLDSKSLEVTPSFYIPFTQTKELCKPILQHWLSSIWFPPSDLEEKKKLRDFLPMYIPFYCFTVYTETTYTAEIGKKCLNHSGNGL